MRMQVSDRDARADGHLTGADVDRVHPREPHGRQHHHRGVVRPRHRAADEPGASPLGEHRQAGLDAQAHHGGDLVGRAGSYDRQHRAREPSRPVLAVRRDHVRVGEHMRRADDLDQRLADVCLQRLGHPPSLPVPGFLTEGALCC